MDIMTPRMLAVVSAGSMQALAHAADQAKARGDKAALDTLRATARRRGWALHIQSTMDGPCHVVVPQGKRSKRRRAVQDGAG